MLVIKSTKLKSLLIRREVSFEKANTFAENRGIEYVETSAKDSKNVDEAFVLVAKKILKKIDEKIIDPKNEVN